MEHPLHAAAQETAVRREHGRRSAASLVGAMASLLAPPSPFGLPETNRRMRLLLNGSLIRASCAALAALAALATVACGGGDKAVTPPPPPPPTVTSVTVTPGVATLLERDSVDLRATATLSDGSSATAAATWSSSAPSVASVSAAGRVTAIGAGEATITATAGGKSGTATISVSRRVATLTLDLAARAMIPGESLTLTATARFGDGSPATGKTVAWTSSAPSVASVSSAGRVTALATGAATVTATVDGLAAAAAITVRPPATTTLDVNARVAGAIGPAGGVLTGSSGGITYRLEIPAGAVATNTSITMTPATAIGNLPLTGGLVGAVELQPAGLALARPATLRIGVAAPPRAGFTLAGFSVTEDGSKTVRAIAGVRANEVVVLVERFGAPAAASASVAPAARQASHAGAGGTAGAAFGTTQDLQSLSAGFGRPAAAQPFVTDFLAASGSTPPNAAALIPALSSWFDVGVLPQLQAANTDAALLSALAEFQLWSVDVFVVSPQGLPVNLNDPALVSRRSLWRAALTPKLVAAVAGNNATCLGQQSVTAMLNVLFWQSKAEFHGIATGPLSRGTVLQGLCATLVVRNVAFPNPVQTNFAADLDAEFALQFGTGTPPVPVPVSVNFTAAGATFARTSPANSDAQGFFTVAVTAQGNASFTVNLIGCLVMAGATDVCALHIVNGSSLDVSGHYTGNFSSTITIPGGVLVPVNVPLNVFLTQTQNGITGTWEVLLFNGPRGSVSAIMFQLQLLNFTLNQFAPCPGVLTGQANFNTTTRNIASTYTGSDCQGTHANGVSTLRPGVNHSRIYEGAWGTTNGGVLTDVYKVRQTGSTVDVSHAVRVNGTLVCRAFYRGTVNGADFLSAPFRVAASGLGNIPPPPASAVIQFLPDFLVSRGADVLLANDPFFRGARARLLGNPPAGCDP